MRITGNFRGIKLSRKCENRRFRGENFRGSTVGFFIFFILKNAIITIQCMAKGGNAICETEKQKNNGRMGRMRTRTLTHFKFAEKTFTNGSNVLSLSLCGMSGGSYRILELS